MFDGSTFIWYAQNVLREARTEEMFFEKEAEHENVSLV